MSAAPLLEVRSATKDFGAVRALHDASLKIEEGSVTCLVGDNGAGKSTLVGVLSGVFPPSTGEYRIGGSPVTLRSPRDAMSHGIATVHQDLALAPLMSVWRNFFLGAEPTRGTGIFRRIDAREARQVTVDQLAQMRIALRDPDQTAGTLSGGERQSLAIARALYLGARVLILDEPTAALGVKQTAVVLRSVEEAKRRGVAVILVTHNPAHAVEVGDQFVVLRKGSIAGRFGRGEVGSTQLAALMAGADEPQSS